MDSANHRQVFRKEHVLVEVPDPYAMQAEISAAKKRLNCCVTGCLGAAVLALAIILGGIWYLYAGREPVKPPAFMAGDAVFMLALRFDFDDEANRAFVTAMKDELLTSDKTTEKVLGALKHISPGWIVISSRSVPDSYTRPPADAVWALTCTHWWRVLNIAANNLPGDEFKEAAAYLDTPVYQQASGIPPYFAVEANSVILTWKLATMHEAIERLKTGKTLPGPLAVVAMEPDWTADATMLSAVTPQSIADYGFSTAISEPPVYIFQLDLKSMNSAVGRIVIALDSEAEAEAAVQALRQLPDEFASKFGVQNTTVKSSGGRIEISFDFTFSEPKELYSLMKRIFQP